MKSKRIHLYNADSMNLNKIWAVLFRLSDLDYLIRPMSENFWSLSEVDQNRTVGSGFGLLLACSWGYKNLGKEWFRREWHEIGEMKEDVALPLLVWKEAPSFFLLKLPSLFPWKRHAGGYSLLLLVFSQVLSQKAKIWRKINALLFSIY